MLNVSKLEWLGGGGGGGENESSTLLKIDKIGSFDSKIIHLSKVEKG